MQCQLPYGWGESLILNKTINPVKNFEFYSDKVSEWRWRLKNTEQQWADSGEGYKQKTECEKSAQLFVTLGPSAARRKVGESGPKGQGVEWEYYLDKAGKWRWRFRAGNNEPIADGTRGYDTEEKVNEAIDIAIKLLKEAAAGSNPGNAYVPPAVGGAASGGRFA